MTDRRDSEFGTEQTQDDAFVGEPPAGDENPGGFRSNDQSGGTSADTGVRYDAQGEPESTPNDDTEPTDPGSNAETSAGTDP
jgi:hypothetical protein